MPTNESIAEQVISHIRAQEDGSLSNTKAELYALALAEEVIPKTPAFLLVFAGGDPKRKPSGVYEKKINTAVRARVEQLKQEKTEALAEGVWGQLRWQANQMWRRAVATGDSRLMEKSSELLLKVAQRIDPAAKAEKPESEDGPARGRGAPAAEPPADPDGRAEGLKNRLINK